MVRGLSIFQAWFKDFENQYVLIGGTAASITMTEAGLPFRGTKDLDIVLHVEALTPAFGQKFWEFVQAGGYQQKEGDPEQKPCLYRFQKSQDEDFPHMLELFSRVPDGLSFVPPGHLTPIPMDEQISSLSAILLNDEYYQFVLAGGKRRLRFAARACEKTAPPADGAGQSSDRCGCGRNRRWRGRRTSAKLPEISPMANQTGRNYNRRRLNYSIKSTTYEYFRGD